MKNMLSSTVLGLGLLLIYTAPLWVGTMVVIVFGGCFTLLGKLLVMSLFFIQFLRGCYSLGKVLKNR